ncbi:MAG: FIST C-terminal domain-containing protein, partial [Alphaproteobacteria bacterium]|nr:FIST C-terminal domain-containing protein [Alphaproteobacteria bacterium]
GLQFSETWTILDDKMANNMVVAFGVYGKDVVIRNGSRGGWKPFGPLRRVTRAQENILYELDGKPALDLYKEYLGDKVADLPSSGLLYPFAIMRPDGNSVGLIRTILNINEDENSLILAGDLEVGQLVCLMHGNTDDLTTAAGVAATRSMADEEADDGAAAICVSCVGRKILMGNDTEEELECVRDILGTRSLAGFYSYGEIALSEDTAEAELHNQTMTITCISEKAG